jgi:hypothetical protein
VRRALADELGLVRQRVVAGRLARHGSLALGPALVALRSGGPGTAMAAEALGVLLRPEEARQVVAILDPALQPAERLARLPATPGPAVGPSVADGWLRDLIEDPDDIWRSPWVRACAIHTARRRGLLAGMDLAAARALGDGDVDEELQGL